MSEIVIAELTKNEAYDKLAKLTNKMNVPSYNVRKAQWLAKNLETRNSDHPDFKEAKELADLIISRGW